MKDKADSPSTKVTGDEYEKAVELLDRRIEACDENIHDFPNDKLKQAWIAEKKEDNEIKRLLESLHTENAALRKEVEELKQILADHHGGLVG